MTTCDVFDGCATARELAYVFTRPIVHLPSQAHGNGKFLQQDLDRQLNALLPVVLYTRQYPNRLEVSLQTHS